MKEHLLVTVLKICSDIYLFEPNFFKTRALCLRRHRLSFVKTPAKSLSVAHLQKLKPHISLWLTIFVGIQTKKWIT